MPDVSECTHSFSAFVCFFLNCTSGVSKLHDVGDGGVLVAHLVLEQRHLSGRAPDEASADKADISSANTLFVT